MRREAADASCRGVVSASCRARVRKSCLLIGLEFFSREEGERYAVQDGIVVGRSGVACFDGDEEARTTSLRLKVKQRTVAANSKRTLEHSCPAAECSDMPKAGNDPCHT